MRNCEQVTRIKTRWKCQLRDGLMRLKGKDYVFRECSGEFNFM